MQNSAALRAAAFRYPQKNSGGADNRPPVVREGLPSTLNNNITI